MKTANRLLTAITTLTMLSAAPAWTQAARPSAPADASATAVRKGMTWQQLTPINFNGTISVSCDNVCDAYHGDTTCTTELPLLCIRKAGAGFPLPLPPSVINSDKYLMWSGGIVGTTHAMVPPRTLTAANAACAKVFGATGESRNFTMGGAGAFKRSVAWAAIRARTSGSTSTTSPERPAGQGRDAIGGPAARGGPAPPGREGAFRGGRDAQPSPRTGPLPSRP
jgi:hypothetical protein